MDLAANPSNHMQHRPRKVEDGTLLEDCQEKIISPALQLNGLLAQGVRSRRSSWEGTISGLPKVTNSPAVLIPAMLPIPCFPNFHQLQRSALNRPFDPLAQTCQNRFPG